ncbi:hypothetical protein GCM10008959_41640 [Deinococcus seoulensis]|uniref:Uncharacterized protein n=2 Tax=Deinococcus seoulensis TaxID=1837379 RepID=A0ABQ2RX14_9DEIO|nr:hypothetical protein GCM10008959_41640 [Deinococcus seoulensis]
MASWPYTSTYVRARFVYNDTSADMTPGAIPSSGTVNSKLPDLTPAKSLLDGCTLSSGFQGTGAKYDLAAFQVFSNQGDLLGRIFENAAASDSGYLHIYASSAATLKGVASCTARSETLNFDATMTAGWNLLQGTVDPTTNAVRIVNAPAGAQASLDFVKYQDHVLIVPVNKTDLRLKRGDSVNVPVRIFQDGGVSGRIRLTSNVYGLDVTPTEIDLPANVGKQSVTAKRLSTQLSGTALQAQRVDTSLTLTASSNGAAFDGDLIIQATKAGMDVGGGKIGRLALAVPQLGLEAPTKVAPQNMSTEWPVYVYTNEYTGDVRVSVSGLPAGLSVAPKTVSVTPNQSVTVKFTIQPTTTVPVGTYTVTVNAEQVSDGNVTSRRGALTIMPTPVRMVEGTSSMTADNAGNIWYTTTKGMVRQRPDGTYDAFTNPGYGCGDLTAGEDGGIWQQSSPQVRFDAVTGSATVKPDPRGFSGCAGSGMHYDPKGRGWVSYFNIQRLDYATNTVSNVPGAQDDQLLDVDGSHVWGYTQSGGTSQLVSIDADTLTRTTLTLPGINAYLPAFARGGKLWLPKSVPYRLTAYDPAAGKVTSYDVVIDGATVKDFEVVGVDATGRHWLKVSHMDGELYLSEWVLYNPLTAQVEKRVPAIFLSGNGKLSSVSADGTLWVITTDAPDYVPYAYAFKP